ncbi:MAG: S41 family peptidase, partial [Eubacteriales bacterium]
IVNLTIYREGQSDYLEILVERRQIENETVAYEMLDNQIAYINVGEFDTVTEAQFREALLVSEANQMQGMILDLRGNPGGNLTTVVEMLRMILPEGIIVYTEDKYGDRVEYTGKGENPLEVPLVVLVDGNSASASEIMAGAIQDYGIGTIMGGTTYGKGIVQRIITLSDGTAVKLTVSRYYTASGKEIHGVGIIPDVEVLFDAQTYVEYGIDNQLECAIEYMEEQIQAVRN